MEKNMEAIKAIITVPRLSKKNIFQVCKQSVSIISELKEGGPKGCI
jgi:hypothetical protein